MIIAGTMVKCDICGSEKFLKPDCNDGWNNLILQSFTGPVMEKVDKPPMVLCKDCLHEDCAMYHSPNWFCANGEKREES